MILRVGDHYRNTAAGRRLYKEVRQYTCPRGCRGAYFDFRYARPVDRPERLFRLIPVPGRVLNVVDPLLVGGLGFAYLMFVAGILLMRVGPLFKVAGIVAITVCAALLLMFMRGKEPEGQTEG